MMPVTNPPPMVHLGNTREGPPGHQEGLQGLREKMRVMSAWVPIVHWSLSVVIGRTKIKVGGYFIVQL